MAHEDIRAAIDLLLDQVARHPEDRGMIDAQLHEKLVELRALGVPVPMELARLEQRLADDDEDETVDLFDNLPV